MGLIKHFLYYDELIDLLEEKGLIIEDRGYAKQVLSEVNYYRLVNAYALGLYEDNKKEKFRNGVTFQQIHSLYLFDTVLRHAISELLESFEIMFRARIVNFIGDNYGALGYLDWGNFEDVELHNSFIDKFNQEMETQSKSPVVKHHLQEYDGNLPIWAAVEIISFGNLSKLYKNMKKADKTAIAKDLGTTSVYLDSWLAAFVEVRNICAHYGRLYNKLLLSTPKTYKNDVDIVCDRVFIILYYLKRFADPRLWNSMMLRIESAMIFYPRVDLRCIGFPLNWQALLSTGMYKPPEQYSYPAIITIDKDSGMSAFFPNFNVEIIGENYDEIVLKTREKIGRILLKKEDECRAIPVPLKLENLKAEVGQKGYQIDIDMRPLRQEKNE